MQSFVLMSPCRALLAATLPLCLTRGEQTEKKLNQKPSMFMLLDQKDLFSPSEITMGNVFFPLQETLVMLENCLLHCEPFLCSEKPSTRIFRKVCN